MPKLAVFPKAYMHALCKDGSMRVAEWLELAGKLDIEGLEWYAGFLEMSDERNWSKFCSMSEDHRKVIPMGEILIFCWLEPPDIRRAV